jgi:hypothetical protein
MALPALLEDYLFIGPLLRERLLAEVPDVPVDLCETVDQVLAADRRERVLMVMWAGDAFPDTPGSEAGAGKSVAFRQRWLVLLALNNVSAARTARNDRAGALLSQVHKAVSGWAPDGAHRPFRRANAPLRPDINQAKAIYPMGFEIQLNL